MDDCGSMHNTTTSTNCLTGLTTTCSCRCSTRSIDRRSIGNGGSRSARAISRDVTVCDQLHFEDTGLLRAHNTACTLSTLRGVSGPLRCAVFGFVKITFKLRCILRKADWSSRVIPEMSFRRGRLEPHTSAIHSDDATSNSCSCGVD